MTVKFSAVHLIPELPDFLLQQLLHHSIFRALFYRLFCRMPWPPFPALLLVASASCLVHLDLSHVDSEGYLYVLYDPMQS